MKDSDCNASSRIRIGIMAYHYPVAVSPTLVNTARFWINQSASVWFLLDRYIFDAIDLKSPLCQVQYLSHLPPIHLYHQKTVIHGSPEPKKDMNNGNPLGKKRIKARYSLIKDRLFAKMELLPINPLLIEYFINAFISIKKNKINYIVAAEPEAGFFAFLLLSLINIPYYYQSLEIAPVGGFKNSIRSFFEKCAINNCSVFVVQDQVRFDEIRKNRDLNPRITHFLPVSLSGPPVTDRHDYLQKKYNLSKNLRVILYVGAINATNQCLEIALQTNSDKWKNDWILIIHGFTKNKTYIDKILSATSRDKVILSTDPVPWEELDMVISSADVGVALYNNIDKNNELTIFSSGKIANYLKCCLPLIISDVETNIQFIHKYRCGVTISEINGISDALIQIFNNYSNYRINACNCFTDCYEFEKNYCRLQHEVMGSIQ